MLLEFLLRPKKVVLDSETAQIRVWKNVEKYCAAFQKFCEIISLDSHEKGKHAITPLDLRIFLSTYELEFKCH